MLKGKQKKLDANKDGKISGEDFAMLKSNKKPKEMKNGGMNKMNKKDKNMSKMHKMPDGKMMKNSDMKKKIVKAEDGMMIEGAQSPSMIEGLMGEISAQTPTSPDRISEIDIAMAEEAARRRPLSALGEEKEKPMTPKERREKDIAKRAKKKMGGGMMMQEPMGYKKGGGVRGGRAEMKGLRPAKLL